jgi:hypothetical protein
LDKGEVEERQAAEVQVEQDMLLAEMAEKFLASTTVAAAEVLQRSALLQLHQEEAETLAIPTPLGLQLEVQVEREDLVGETVETAQVVVGEVQPPLAVMHQEPVQGRVVQVDRRKPEQMVQEVAMALEVHQQEHPGTETTGAPQPVGLVRAVLPEEQHRGVVPALMGQLMEVPPRSTLEVVEGQSIRPPMVAFQVPEVVWQQEKLAVGMGAQELLLSQPHLGTLRRLEGLTRLLGETMYGPSPQMEPLLQLRRAQRRRMRCSKT